MFVCFRVGPVLDEWSVMMMLEPSTFSIYSTMSMTFTMRSPWQPTSTVVISYRIIVVASSS